MEQEQQQEQEQVLWSGSPSQILNLRWFVIGALLCVLIVPVIIAWWRWFELRHHRIEVTNQRIRVRKGVFNRHTDELELYRVKDTELFEPLLYRLVGAGTIVLHTSDRTSGTLELEAIPRAGAVRETIRGVVEQARRKRGVREVDVD
jgi:uncharacterized membrane protein YdbT with pleckstrin-like domain